ncbi:cyclic GMP-AMP synthase-like receptor [Mytilus galloprovincialis]|uniref:cyclic GMP-AMP synthase-like receptor n=1 Tax=Mytilus galloprovincialis TaxID=29158 RepID=UPI003F7C8FAE
MNLNDRSLSLQFYKYLCNIVGSEAVVRTRRDIFSAKDIVDNTCTISTTFISSGSKAEGLDLKGSDYDIMILANFLLVYESLNNVQYDPRDIILFMDTNDTTPGFTKLKLANKSHLDVDVIRNWSETVGKETYISSKLFRERDVPDNMIIHGPCRSSVDGQLDGAGCFRCKQWITPAQQWIHRSRAAWPDSMLVTAAVQYGVLFVPIGCKDSPNEDLQWRISFSVTEKLLIYSFSHIQLLCYASMKIILKDFIKPRHGDLLCSYFLKTIMFWLSEEINPSEWKPENMISCLSDCIRRLIYYVEYKTCLHYFIPENNLFEDRFTDKEHKELINTLRFIYESPFISVLDTSTFQNYRLESLNSRGMILSASELPCYSYLRVFRQNIMFNSESIYRAIKHLGNVCVHKELRTYIFSTDARKRLQSSNHCNMMARNKLFYQQYKRTLFYLKISSFSPENYWMDGSDFLVEGEWRWIDQVNAWSPGQPDNAGTNEHCLEIRYSFGVHWNDYV